MTTLLCQNGWPVLEPGDPRLHAWVIPAHNGHLTLTYRNGSAGLVLSHCLLRLSEQVEDLTQFDSKHNLIKDDWGLAIRPVRGQTTGYSNHAGYAADANATRHPLGVEGTFSRTEVAQIHRILAQYHGVIRWGGDYHTRKDEMHWEINDGVTMHELERVARRLADTPRGHRILKANPGQRRVVFS